MLAASISHFDPKLTWTDALTGLWAGLPTYVIRTQSGDLPSGFPVRPTERHNSHVRTLT